MLFQDDQIIPEIGKEFQCRSHDAMTVYTSIIFIRYMMLVINAKEEQAPPRHRSADLHVSRQGGRSLFVRGLVDLLPDVLRNPLLFSVISV